MELFNLIGLDIGYVVIGMAAVIILLFILLIILGPNGEVIVVAVGVPP